MTSPEDLHADLAALIGTTLHDRYEIVGLLGAGGMGAVFKARHTGLARDVAIKVLHPDLSRDPSTGKRFEREATSASRLDHPNCVRVTDFGTTAEGVTYLVMELLDGSELLDRMGKPWAPATAVAVAKQIFSGLEHAHHVGIVHRDLKPENVFLTTDYRGEELVKLVDFGIAKLLDEQGVEKLTRQGIVFGTPRYMSPEQAAGGKIDERTDLYAAGLIFYELLAGRPPFEAKEAAQLLRMQIMVPPPPLPSTVPDGLAAIVMKLLEKSKGDRYTDAREVLTALEAVEGGLVGVSPAPAAGAAAAAVSAATGAATAPTGALTGASALTGPAVAATSALPTAADPSTGATAGQGAAAAAPARPGHSGVAWEPAAAAAAPVPVRSGATIASDASLPILGDPSSASGRVEVGPTGSHPSLSASLGSTAAMSGAGAASLATGSNPSLASATVPTTVASPPPTDEPNKRALVPVLIGVVVLLALGGGALALSGVLGSDAETNDAGNEGEVSTAAAEPGALATGETGLDADANASGEGEAGPSGGGTKSNSDTAAGGAPSKPASQPERSAPAKPSSESEISEPFLKTITDRSKGSVPSSEDADPPADQKEDPEEAARKAEEQAKEEAREAEQKAADKQDKADKKADKKAKKKAKKGRPQ